MDGEFCGRTYVTGSQVVIKTPAILIGAFLVPSGASTGTIIYNGNNNSGDEICRLESAVRTGLPFFPPEPVKCEKGIFVTVGSNTTGVLILWRAVTDD